MKASQQNDLLSFKKAGAGKILDIYDKLPKLWQKATPEPGQKYNTSQMLVKY